MLGRSSCWTSRRSTLCPPAPPIPAASGSAPCSYPRSHNCIFWRFRLFVSPLSSMDAIQFPMLMCSGLVFHPEENVVFSATQDSLKVRQFILTSNPPLRLPTLRVRQLILTSTSNPPNASPCCLLTCPMACADGRRLRGSPVCASTRSPWPGAACTTSPPTPPPPPWYVP